MRRVVGIIFCLFILLCSALLASDVKVLEANEAIRLIGSRDVIFVSADDNKSNADKHIVHSVNISAKDIRFLDYNGSLTCIVEYLCPKDSKALLEERGIKNGQTIIVYDQFDGVNASALYSFFEVIGHKDIKILNGGAESIRLLDPNQKIYNKLQKEYEAIKTILNETKEKIDTKEKKKLLSKINNITAKMNLIKPNLLTRNTFKQSRRKSQYRSENQKMNFTHIASDQDIQIALSDINKNKEKSQYVILDTRSKGEMVEQKIPQAIAIESKNFSNFKEKKSFKSIKEMQKIVDNFGIKKDKTIYTYSKNSVGRGSHVALALRILGYKKVKVFSGKLKSWSDSNQSREHQKEF